MPRPPLSVRLLTLAGVLCALAAPGTVRAQVSVTPTVTGNFPLFTYSYSVVNLTPLDLAIISVDMLANPLAVQNPVAPPGFLISFDPGFGTLFFLEDADPLTLPTFAPGSTVSGFTFQSPFGPTAGSFNALDINGNSFTGQTLAAATVPEPGTLLLGLAPGLLLMIRRRRSHRTFLPRHT